MNSTMQICFYEETINIPIADSFPKFQQVIGQKFFLDAQDVKELIIYFVAGINKYLILNQQDYAKAITFLKDSNNQKLTMKFDLEVSEKSRLFQAEVATTKDKQTDKDKDKDIKENQEKLKKEILEKERMLKQLLENERKAKLEADKIEKEKALKEKLEAERAAKEKLLKEKKLEAERIAKEKDEKAKLEKDKEDLKASVSKAVIDALNSNLEKFKGELMEKALLETSRAIEKSVLLKSTVSRINDAVHEGTKCSNCGMCPIRGNRYQCTVCFNYDLCNDCEEIVGESHPHGLLKIRTDKAKTGKDKVALTSKEDNKLLKLVCQRLAEMKQQYDLSAFQDKQIVDALMKCKGNPDEALETLFK